MICKSVIWWALQTASWNGIYHCVSLYVHSGEKPVNHATCIFLKLINWWNFTNKSCSAEFLSMLSRHVSWSDPKMSCCTFLHIWWALHTASWNGISHCVSLYFQQWREIISPCNMRLFKIDKLMEFYKQILQCRVPFNVESACFMVQEEICHFDNNLMIHIKTFPPKYVRFSGNQFSPLNMLKSQITNYNHLSYLSINFDTVQNWYNMWNSVGSFVYWHKVYELHKHKTLKEIFFRYFSTCQIFHVLDSTRWT